MIGYFNEWVKRSDLKTLAILNDSHDMTMKHRRLFLILRKKFLWQQKKNIEKYSQTIKQSAAAASEREQRPLEKVTR